MSVHKDQRTGKWEAHIWYRDSRGSRKRKHKRGFKTRKEAELWSSDFRIASSYDGAMTLAQFAKEVYAADTRCHCTLSRVISALISIVLGQRRTFRRRSARFWNIWALPELVDEIHRVIYVDGIYLAKDVVILIACSDEYVLSWYLARAETAKAWKAHNVSCSQMMLLLQHLRRYSVMC